MKTKLLFLLLLANFSIYAQQYTAIPDLNFEKKLIALSIDSGTPDGQVLTSKISGVLTLDLSSSSISNLTGIQDFISLKELNCNENRTLTSVNISNNIALEKATFVRCPLTSINVNTNINLTELNFGAGGSSSGQEGSGAITSLDISHNPKLRLLDCSHHKIATLDFRANPLLEVLSCGGNKYTVLDLSKNLALTNLSINNALLLSTIDVSANTKLTTLSISDAILTKIDLSKNIALQSFYCTSANYLQEVNLKNGKNGLIVPSRLYLNATPSLYCVLVDNVEYSEANWSINKDSSLKFSLACETPKYTLIPDTKFEKILIRLGIDGPSDGKVLTSRIAGIKELKLNYSGDYQEITDLTGIEDFAALEKLETPGTKMGKLNVSKNTALKYLSCRGENLSSLDISNNKNLTYLSCGNNKLTTLDVASHTLLTELDFSSNSIAQINLSNNKALTNVIAESNNLTNLDLSSNTNLEVVSFGSNLLTSIDFSKNIALKNISGFNTLVTELNLTSNIALKNLTLYQSKISTLDLSKNKALTDLYLSNNNNLTEINLKNGNNTALAKFDIRSNTHLDCVLVDNTEYSNTNWKNKENWTKFGSVCATAYTLIPDVEFEKALIARNIDLVLDGKISTALAAEIKVLDLQQYTKISDLTGIEAFVSLETLLTPLSTSGFKTLNLNNNKALKSLTINYSLLTSLDLSKNIALKSLELKNNKNLTELNLQNQQNNLIAGASLNLTNNTTLTCIMVDDVAYSNTNWASQKDPWATYTKVCSAPKYTLIPDIEFEKALISTGIDNIEDGKVLTARIAVEKKIDLRYSPYQKITDLTGIEDFTALETLNTPGTKLGKLNLTKNTALKTLNCSGEDLSTLDLTNNINLVTLDCSSNKLTSPNLSKNLALESLNAGTNILTNLDLQNNTALTSLNVVFNTTLKSLDLSKNTNLTTLSTFLSGLESLDVSSNKKLTSISCQSSKLTSLDVSNNTLLVSLNCSNNLLKSLNLKNGTNNLFGTSLNFKGNSNLTCIQVDNVTYSDANWTTYKDATAKYNLDCTTYTLIPDSNFEDKLIALKIDKDGKNGKVATLSIAAVTSLDVSSSSIKDLTGIQDFTSLKILNCSTNQLTSLTPASNLLLTELNCSSNLITAIDVSKNKSLTALNVSNNNLTTLNVKNGFNTNMDWFSVNFTKNASLSCIQVDNAKYSNDNWNGKLDKTSYFAEDCSSFTAIPDSNFEDKLIALKIDIDGKNGKVLTSSISKITDLNVQLSDIKDLTGIQDFTSLEFLNCQFNFLTSLNVTKNSKLIELYTHGNDLTTLNVSTNTALTTLQVNKNKLTALDISKNTKLVYVNVSENALKTLNLKNGNNNNFTTAFMFKNPALLCIQVDNASFATTSSIFSKDATASYSATCTLGIEDSVFDKVVMYPNPTKGEVNINNVSLEKATVYNSLGQLVKSFVFNSGDTNNTINLSGLPKGIYYVYLISEDAASAKKVIVE